MQKQLQMQEDEISEEDLALLAKELVALKNDPNVREFYMNKNERIEDKNQQNIASKEERARDANQHNQDMKKGYKIYISIMK
jgi:hypothetical protein